MRFQDLAGMAQGTLIEKCRYGAVVRRDDETPRRPAVALRRARDERQIDVLPNI